MKVLHIALILAVTSFAADLESGKRSFEEKHYEQAETTFRDVVNAEPDNLEANYYLGATLLEMEKYREAQPFFEKAATGMYRAESGELNHYRGMILLKQNKFDDSYKELSKAVELNPKDAYAYYYLAMASSRIKRPDQMVKNFQMFLQLAPDAPETPKVKSLLKAL